GLALGLGSQQLDEGLGGREVVAITLDQPAVLSDRAGLVALPLTHDLGGLAAQRAGLTVIEGRVGARREHGREDVPTLELPRPQLAGLERPRVVGVLNADVLGGLERAVVLTEI